MPLKWHLSQGGLKINMSQPWNLTPAQWSDVLLRGLNPDKLARRLPNDNSNPWGATLIEYTKDSETILDLGSGRGQHSAMLALAGKHTTLVDWSLDNIEFSVKLFESLKMRGTFCRADMLKSLPFKNDTFDTVFSCGVFEYFSDDEIREILKEAFRVARKQVIIMVPNAFSIPYRIGKFYMEKRGTWEWGGERPFATMKPYFTAVGCHRIHEVSVAAKTSLNFLTMRGGGFVKGLATTVLRLTDHGQPSLFKQGYLLITIGQKLQ